MKSFVCSVLVLFAPTAMAHDGHATSLSAVFHYFFAPHGSAVTIVIVALLIFPLVVAKRLK